VVDDEADLREVLRIYLEGLGFEVAEAADGLSALEMLRVEQFDHVITDLVMPRMNGYMLIDEARRLTPRGRLGPRFVVVTGSAALDDLPAGPSGVSEHVHGYLRKPFDMDQLLDLLS
jgi:CheY-like chemotaxis protein